ncbi:MAG: hypothetical protein JXR25_02530 [Pontiellaceae bacterium]|nr:hypothetical protein [Pontiellaceae bacterium]MBN2783678.1 hypothetical protein [Pontiellaceae bacterium]
MRAVQKFVWVFGITGIYLGLPLAGQAAFQGSILVYARSSTNGQAPPPLTSALLNGGNSRGFGTNDLVTYTGSFETGLYAVEVSSVAEGYVLRQSTTDPNALNDPYSAFGNPRYVAMSEGTNATFVSFQFDPVITAAAGVRDAWTMQKLEHAAVAFEYRTTGGATVAVGKYPWSAEYATNWTTDVTGRFPANTILYLADYDLTVSKSGYLPYNEINIITNAAPGDAYNLGTVFLEPEDSNTNRIADAWEVLYFGTGSSVSTNADPDGDGMDNRSEYVAGTDPTNALSCLQVESSVISNGFFELRWNVEPDHTYIVCGTTNLCADSWVQIGGPWEAAPDQYEMVWVETNTDLSWNNLYRVEVVSSWWLGTNQTLINTNRPAPPSGGGGVYTNGPPIPGL